MHFPLINIFLGETFDAEWDSTNNVDLLVFFPEPYWFCFNGGYTWTCSTIGSFTVVEFLAQVKRNKPIQKIIFNFCNDIINEPFNSKFLIFVGLV